MDKCVPIDECKDGYLYLIDARHAHVGICQHDGTMFKITREKFGNVMLDIEYHYDADRVMGTAHPLRVIEKAPTFKSEQDMLVYLKEKGAETRAEMDDIYRSRRESL